MFSAFDQPLSAFSIKEDKNWNTALSIFLATPIILCATCAYIFIYTLFYEQSKI